MTAQRVAHATPGMELLGHTLDLGRPELQDVMNRYSGRRPLEQGSLLSPPVALIVGDGEPSPLQATLEEEGWRVSTCGGPAGPGACPLMSGRPCTLRESADVAAVYVDHGGARGLSLPLLRCAADHAAPAVVALKGRIDEPRYDGTRAAVGALRGPAAVAAAMRAVVERAAG